jgi:hypothetical protein
VPKKALEIEAVEESAGWEWELSAGIDSNYIFRGQRIQEDTGWGQISLDVPLSDKLALNLTPWFAYAGEGDYNEFDFNTNLYYTLGKYEISFGYAAYIYPTGSFGGGDGTGDEQEYSLALSRDIWTMNASATAVYNLPWNGFYYEFRVEQPYEFSDRLSFNLSAAVGFDRNYFGPGTKWNHLLATLETPIKLTESLVLTPYAALNVPWGHLDYEPTKLFGGVRLGWSF